MLDPYLTILRRQRHDAKNTSMHINFTVVLPFKKPNRFTITIKLVKTYNFNQRIDGELFSSILFAFFFVQAENKKKTKKKIDTKKKKSNYAQVVYSKLNVNQFNVFKLLFIHHFLIFFLIVSFLLYFFYL